MAGDRPSDAATVDRAGDPHEAGAAAEVPWRAAPCRCLCQAVEDGGELHPLTGHANMVFCGERHHDRAMSENTINAALRAMGFSADEVTGHGFRATARTMLQGKPGFDPDVIEAQLAHAVRDRWAALYNRTEFLEQRRKTLQGVGANYLDKLRQGAPVVRLSPQA